jgi:hypothetical protein
LPSATAKGVPRGNAPPDGTGARDQLLAKLTETCLDLEERVARLEHAACGECRRNLALGMLAEIRRSKTPPKKSRSTP